MDGQDRSARYRRSSHNLLEGFAWGSRDAELATERRDRLRSGDEYLVKVPPRDRWRCSRRKESTSRFRRYSLPCRVRRATWQRDIHLHVVSLSTRDRSITISPESISSVPTRRVSCSLAERVRASAMASSMPSSSWRRPACRLSRCTVIRGFQTAQGPALDMGVVHRRTRGGRLHQDPSRRETGTRVLQRCPSRSWC